MKAALIIFDRLTLLDFIGFYDAITRLKSMSIMPDFEWNICALSGDATDDRGRGLRIAADSIGQPLGGYDMIFLPGGLGTRTLQHDAAFVDWIRTAADVPLKVSACAGSLLLGAAGYLKGKRATTHPSAFKELEPYCAKVVDERVVDEGNVVTGRGVSASIDLGLYIVQRLAGGEARARVAKQMDYPYTWQSA